MKNHNILKNLCNVVFVAGSGNFWLKENHIGDDNSFLYRFYRFVLFSIYGFMTILEILAAVIGDFPDDEQSDAVTFAVSHTIVMIKIFSVIYRKELVKTLNRNMVRVCEIYETKTLMEEQYRIMKINVIAYFVTVYGSAAFFIIAGARKMREGSHFITIVTYWPGHDDDTGIATVFRIFTTVVLCVMMVTMVSIDSFAMVYLIMYKYKFITLRHYFEELRKEFDEASKSSLELASDKLTQGLVDGIEMHKKLLRLSRDIDRSFGTVMALQVCLSSGSAVSLLLHLALSKELTFVVTMKILFFGVALFFLLALFVCNAGEITYQASLLADSIFYCGWYACPSQSAPRRNIRQLVLLAVAQAQRPIVMKAFNMLELTYGTFISVVRGTYSVFTLIYAQNT
uniref:Odorant receptor n=1 Tax=Eogystia hippophaecolus TaxID=1206364 RepID=A0A1B3P5N2_EOGHI|nr:odorant receptor [Eogystia hippophaecolus]